MLQCNRNPLTSHRTLIALASALVAASPASTFKGGAWPITLCASTVAAYRSLAGRTSVARFGSARRVRTMCRALLIVVLWAVIQAATAETITGRVVGVADGDTITVLDADKRQHRIRVAGIDAPERGQPSGFRSKESLGALVHEQPVRVEWEKRDRFGRIVGKVWAAPADSACRGEPACPMTLDAGLEQIKLGRAWWFRKYAEDQTSEDRGAYAEAEAEARAAQRGLWRDADPVAPWDWRTRSAVKP